MPDLHTHYRPGAWTLHTRGESWLLTSVPADDEFTLHLWDCLDGPPDARIVMASLMDRYGALDLPGFAFATATPDGFDVWVGSTARASCGDLVVIPDEGAPWVARRLTGTRLVLSACEADEARARPLLPLTGGVVLADLVVTSSGGRVEPESAVATQGDQAEQERESVLVRPVGEDFDLLLRGMSSRPDQAIVQAERHPPSDPEPKAFVDKAPEDSTRFWEDGRLTSPAPVATPTTHPLPAPAADQDEAPMSTTKESGDSEPAQRAVEAELQTVLAASCPGGHWTPAFTPLCRVCGVPIASQSEVSIPRPRLGVLRLVNGDSIDLDRGVILGRAPLAPAEGPDRPHVITLSNFGRDISRTHAEVVLDGWHVLIQDLGSANGTRLTAPGRSPEQLTPYELYAVEPDSTIEIAEVTTIRFEAPSSDDLDQRHPAVPSPTTAGTLPTRLGGESP